MESQWRAVPCIQYSSSLQDGTAYVCVSGTGSKAPQLVTALLPITMWAVILQGRETVKLAETSVEASFKSLSLHSVEVTFKLSQTKGDAPSEPVLVSTGCCSKSAALMLWFTVSQQHPHKCYCSLITQSTCRNPVGGRGRPCGPVTPWSFQHIKLLDIIVTTDDKRSYLCAGFRSEGSHTL